MGYVAISSEPQTFENGMSGAVNSVGQQGPHTGLGGGIGGSTGQMGQSNHALDPATMHHHSMANMMQR